MSDKKYISTWWASWLTYTNLFFLLMLPLHAHHLPHPWRDIAQVVSKAAIAGVFMAMGNEIIQQLRKLNERP